MELLAAVAFAIFVVMSLSIDSIRNKLRRRSISEWILDMIGLLNQGFIAGLAVGWIISQILTTLFRKAAGSLQIESTVLFFGSLLLFDYAFYWSHRFFHRSSFFSIHFIHHTSTEMDVFATSRNTLWQPLIYPNVWLISLSLWLSSNPTPIILAIEILAIFDFWNHSSLHLPKSIQPSLQRIFITTRAHEWHHSFKHYRKNFGNVFSLWDRIHGTYYAPGCSPDRIGLPHKASWWKMLIFPLGRKQ